MTTELLESSASLQTRRIAKITRIVAEYYGLTPKALMADGREEPRVTQRQLAMYLARSITRASYPALTVAFGKRDHMTLIHAFHAVPDKCLTDRKLKRQSMRLKKRCRAALRNMKN